ncbi:hypothetical protein AKJ41_05715 [candidate division MSBL1 archaeon SCGC-AAA259O05]|uniref:Uncharacterized protein n=1 Tax=candidate division MSBL1 archaeon SCGC-AAA259O05 TaxID=1698271 RepID=A0A133UYJ1_9EURY|nr:hypothetical protein AKJ41_05715 [candidate division MSBL1 archaeon SCGC-AAA259O05]
MIKSSKNRRGFRRIRDVFCFLAVGAGFIISGIAIMGFYGEIPFGILESLGMGAMLACSVIGISFAFSSYLNGGMGATIATILFFMVISPIISSSLEDWRYKGKENF